MSTKPQTPIPVQRPVNVLPVTGKKQAFRMLDNTPEMKARIEASGQLVCSVYSKEEAAKLRMHLIPPSFSLVSN